MGGHCFIFNPELNLAFFRESFNTIHAGFNFFALIAKTLKV